VDIFVGWFCGDWAVDCPFAGKTPIQAITVYNASIPAYRAGGKPIEAKIARRADIIASLRNNCFDCDALCSANVAHQRQAGKSQVCLLPWFGQFDVNGIL